MDRQLTRYKDLIKEVVTEWATAGQVGNSPVKSLMSSDDEHENYLMVVAGWERHHNIIFHAHILAGKVWTHWDGTSSSI